MSDPPPGKQSKKSRLLRLLKGLFSKSPSPSHQGHPSVTPHNANASISACTTYGSQVNSQDTEYTAIVDLPTTPSVSALPNAASAPQINPQGIEYTAILEPSTTPSGPLTREHRMKELGSTAYEGLKAAIQGIHDCSGIFPPLQTTAGVLLTISKVVDVCRSMCSTCE